LLLVAVGLLFFRERLSVRNLLGVALCLGGLILVVQP
jgi:drug/metabolite transporter (DMT)-like permease